MIRFFVLPVLFAMFVAGLNVQPVNAALPTNGLPPSITHCVLPSKVLSTTLNVPRSNCIVLEIVQFWNCIHVSFHAPPVRCTAVPVRPMIVQLTHCNAEYMPLLVLVRLMAMSPSKVNRVNCRPSCPDDLSASTAVAQLLTHPL